MSEEDFAKFLLQLKGLKDNKAIALYVQQRENLTDKQRVIVVETFLIQCIAKIAGIENIVGKINI